MPKIDPKDSAGAQFTTTSWSLVARAGHSDSPEAMQSLAALCQGYWYPIYAYLRRRGHSQHEAEDLTQGFFMELLSKDFLKWVDSSKGKFRSFLLAALGNYLANRHDWNKRIKRGGNIPHLSLDMRDAENRYVREPSHEATPERLFERRWALTLLARVLDQLEDEANRGRKGLLLDRLRPVLMGENEAATYAQIGAELGMTEGAVKVAAHRLRQRYRVLLHEEIARTLAEPGDCAQEISDLFLALSL